jgi:hypothetical protein
MAFNSTNLSALSQGLASNNDWDDLVNYDGELYDPLFQGDVDFTNGTADQGPSYTSDPHTLEAFAPEQLYNHPLATSTLDGPSSDYATSAPQSVVEGPSSFGQQHSWLSGSPSYTTTATSPLAARHGLGYEGSFGQGSFDGCGDRLSQLRVSTASPFPDTQSFGSSSSYHTAAASIFNPHLATSPHAFNNLDVSASEAFANVGGWAEPTIEPIPELHHEGSMPIPVPRTATQQFSNTFSPQPWGGEAFHEQTRARAITIPNANRAHRPVQLQWAPRTPSRLSISPETKRLPRSAPLARSLSNISKSDSRRSRNKLSTISPTSANFGWVSYQPDAQTNRLVPSGAEGGRGRRVRGRTGALTAEQRSHAALMRRFVSCSNCKRRKEKCDTGFPCKSCLDHYKEDLINHPCRDRLLSDLSTRFLSERLGWHPTVRAIDTFLLSKSYHVSTFAYQIPLHFGFGPALHLSVNPIEINDTLYHQHVVYAWPPSSSSKEIHIHAVLPAVLASEASSNLKETLDHHLTLLVRKYFREFPLYRSPLHILREVYVFYRTLPTGTAHARLLQQALKLLVLVHIGGDITIPSPSHDPILEQLVNSTMILTEPTTPTPCFIRSQFGSVMPALALALMKELLSSLEVLFVKRDSREWPVSLATLLVVLMTVESIQYHAAKIPYHDSYGTSVSHTKQENDNIMDDEGVKSLLNFYSACFPGCHARLSADWHGEGEFGITPEDKFVQSVRDAIKTATPYLESKATAERIGDDMGFFFDRLAARLLVLRA